MERSRPILPAQKDDGKLRALGVSFGLTIAATVLSVVSGVLVVVPLFVLGFDIGSPAAIVILLVGGQLGFLAVGYLYARRYGLSVPLRRPNRRGVGYAIGGAIAALAVATGMSALLTRLGLTPGAVLEELVTQNPMVAIWMALLSIVVIAPVEEYLFRGVIQGRLRQTFSAPTAIVLASLLFGSLHFGNYIGSVSTVVGWSLLIAGVGVIFGGIYERTNTLIVPIAAHALYNTVLFTAGYLTV